MLITALERERQQIFQKGKMEREIEVAKAMLAKRLDVALIAEITGLPEERLSRLKAELAPNGQPKIV